MDVELLEIRDFLAQQTPFSLLTEEQLDPLPKQMAIRYLRRGSPFPPNEVEKEYLYLLRQGAVEIRGDGHELIDQYAEGDLYSARCQLDHPEREMTGLTLEDTLVYLLPCDTVEVLREDNTLFSEQLDSSTRIRLKHALSTILQPQAGENRLMQIPVWELIRREPVHVNSHTAIREAAKTMSRQRVSSLLVIDDDELVGIVTDRDLRTRCLAEGVDPAQPISEIMSTELETISSEARAFEALLHMTRLNVHHMPVMDVDEIHGLITHSDILHMERSHAIYLAAQIKRAQDLTELEQITARLPELQAQLIEQGNNAEQLGQVMAAVHDALTLRLLELAESELGQAPIDYCWFVMGSMARREATVDSDQDNALVLGDNYNESQHHDYFERLAEFVCDGLDRCGFRFCPGEMMASNARWRKTVIQWQQTFEEYYQQASPQAVREACNFLDLRAVAGRKKMLGGIVEFALSCARDYQGFMMEMVNHVLEQRTPLGFFRKLILMHDEQHEHQLDLKAGGLMPLIGIARFYAVNGASLEMNTLARLEAACENGEIHSDTLAELSDAFHLIATVRARHQVSQIRHGREINSFLDPDDLSQLERNHLKDAFRMISKQQKLLRQRFLDSGSL
ncbi:MAG: cyclic nucleotide-binding/CBS domain-containing protein [Gammaproteobacteria bacterium]|nr:cyclic nucleotide-binding/CBS domain-containing protein [Gammaproteobacteria bacterium]